MRIFPKPEPDPHVPPVPGEALVWLEARSEEWDEITYPITKVLGPDPSRQHVWLVRYGVPAAPTVPKIFLERYGDQFGMAREELAAVRWDGNDERWHRA